MSHPRAAVAGQARVRLRITCTGVVQGVGFRPAVFRHARALGLAGFVANSPEGAVIEVEGEREWVERFLQTLPDALPPHARLEGVQTSWLAAVGQRDFSVITSLEGRRSGALVPPDLALCADCRREMADPRDRRFRYAFTTCTNCGPRYSLTWALPYDRSRTAMACFPLCAPCQREYEDPANRRFHAEPLCCPTCGPRLKLLTPRGELLGEDAEAISQAQRLLAAGRIVAVKGLGGFQLACRADWPAPVRRLRRRKHRPAKAFALMVADLEAARQLVELTAADEALLTSPQAPILLAPRRGGVNISGAVAPGLTDLGVMLPTTPLHVELFRQAPFPALVMTSGNASDEPICRGNREAMARLSGIADAFLLHDRDVVRRVDDSVARSHPQGPFLVRRSRGYVPQGLPVPEPAPQPLLAMGGFLQNTVAVVVEGQAFLSQHVGDLDTEPARTFLQEVVDNLEQFLQVRPNTVVVDPHPDYPSRWVGEALARQRGGQVLEVQHHVAHAAAVLAEHHAFPAPEQRAGALCLDGTGFGEDGTAWGGEVLELSGRLQWWRRGYLQPLPLVGGEAAVRQPWRVALAALTQAGEVGLARRVFSRMGAQLDSFLALASCSSWPLASGAGRVFEAAGAILGLGWENRYEGELAMRLEAAANQWTGKGQAWPDWQVFLAGPVVRTELLLAELARRRVGGVSRRRLALEFHITFAHLLAELTARVLPSPGPVAVGGGCLVNRLLRTHLREELKRRGFEVFLPVAVPPGDGGLSYGQGVLGAVAMARRVQPAFEGGTGCA
ncbi:MAG: carbamoyltransferase HypF [Thermoanaerobaculum sp.]|nr:carbamoyltransferase HypF [Thermoanaerobaculum sp.]MDW7967197.1 carbamoyltransferase HypF [Thermoanaerobaculum sp.]